MTLEEAISQVGRGNCLLFVGSGFSRGARNLLSADVPLSSGLVEHFLDLAKITVDRNDYDLESAAEKAFDGPSEDKAFEYLAKALRSTKVTRDQENICGRPWRRIYTTNYDDVIETSLKVAGQAYSSLTLADTAEASEAGVTEVVHIHGSISNITKSNFRDEFYLTDVQALDIRFTKSHWNRHFLDDITFADAVFFVGFSNSDFHIRKIIESVSYSKPKCFFVTGPLNEPSRLKIVKHGHICEIGVEGLSSLLDVTPPVPATESVAKPDCLTTLTFENINNTKVLYERAEVRDELLFGSLETQFFSPLEPGRLGVYVDRISSRFDSYLRNPDRCVVIHGSVGNGKSVIARYLAAILQGRFKSVFFYNGRSYKTEAVRQFLSSNAPCLVLIDNLTLSPSFAKLVLDSSPASIVIATDRTKRLEVSIQSLREQLISLSRISIDTLSHAEISRFVEFLDANILWGEYSYLDSVEKKKAFLLNECGAELRGILFALFNGGAVKGRIDEIFGDLDKLNSDYRDLIILLCILSFAYTRNSLGGYVYSYEDFLDIRINFDDFRNKINSSSISEFLESDKGYFRFRSSIFSKYYINKRVDIEYVFQLTFRVLQNIERTHRHDDFHLYSDFSKALMQFNLYRELFSRNSVKDGRLALGKGEFFKIVYSFYERCRGLKIAQNDPLFVIQMSMAQMDSENFDECQSLINSARLICKPGYDPYQIDTHEAEVIAKRSAKFGISDDCKTEYDAFLLLKGVVERRRERYHPFGVVDMLLSLMDSSRNKMTSAGLKRYRSMLEDVFVLTNYFPDELRERYHIISRVHNRAKKLKSSVGI